MKVGPIIVVLSVLASATSTGNANGAPGRGPGLPTDVPLPPSLVSTDPGGFDGAAPSPQFVRAVTSRAGYWGGTVTTPSGQLVQVAASDLYAYAPDWLTAWANWIDAALPHGSELSAAIFVFLTHAEIASVCGLAYGCYSAEAQILVVPGNDFPDGTQMATVIAHEYGHQIARNRDNAPWAAIQTGPKRWASVMNVCARTAAGTAFPGDQGANYWQNPGEVFAETYAKLVWRSATWTDGWWRDWPWEWEATFSPTEAGFGAVGEDVRSPWTGALPSEWTGRVVREQIAYQVKVKTRVKVKGKFVTRTKIVTRYRAGKVVQPVTTISTPNDGTISFAVIGPAGASLTISDPTTGVELVAASATASFDLCGTRSLRLALVGATSGSYTVGINAP